MSTYCPAAVDSQTVKERIVEGTRCIENANDDAGLTIDVCNLTEGGTLALCTMIEWRRTALRKNCRLFFANIPERIQKLIGVYQLDKLIYEGECLPVEEAKT